MPRSPFFKEILYDKKKSTWSEKKRKPNVYARGIDPSALAFSLSLHRHSYISIHFSSRFVRVLFVLLPWQINGATPSSELWSK
jgi:hypothetical protein